MPSTPRAPDLLRPHTLLTHGLQVAAFNVGVSLLMTATRPGEWDQNLVYSEAIGLSIWLLVDVGRFYFKPDPSTGWPRGWRALLLVGGSIVIGYVVGTLLGDLYCGCRTLTSRLQRMGSSGSLLMTLAVSAGISYFFFARSRDVRRLQRIAAVERDAAEAKLKLLETQLEPHMLFNTLANLRVLIPMDPPAAQAMLDRLIAYLRATLAGSRARLHPLRDEFARVDDYLALMKVRMGNRLILSIELPADLGDVPVPTLILQPLVENAIKHGIEPQRGAGRLEVSALRRGRMLELDVKDTGAGSAGATSGTGFGLDQVRTRLATLYRDAAAFSLAPADGGGTLARIVLPIDPPTGFGDAP